MKADFNPTRRQLRARQESAELRLESSSIASARVVICIRLAQELGHWRATLRKHQRQGLCRTAGTSHDHREDVVFVVRQADRRSSRTSVTRSSSAVAILSRSVVAMTRPNLRQRLPGGSLAELLSAADADEVVVDDHFLSSEDPQPCCFASARGSRSCRHFGRRRSGSRAVFLKVTWCRLPGMCELLPSTSRAWVADLLPPFAPLREVGADVQTGRSGLLCHPAKVEPDALELDSEGSIDRVVAVAPDIDLHFS